MAIEKGSITEFEIGKYVCPNSKLLVSLKASRPLAFVDWPVVVERCPDCGERHVLQCEDVYHPPVFGYE